MIFNARASKRKRLFQMLAPAIASLLIASPMAPALAQETPGPNDNNTLTPIKHAILIIGENRTFDHLFGTYKPPKGETIWNLRSKGIVTSTGRPGPNASLGQQYQA